MSARSSRMTSTDRRKLATAISKESCRVPVAEQKNQLLQRESSSSSNGLAMDEPHMNKTDKTKSKLEQALENASKNGFELRKGLGLRECASQEVRNLRQKKTQCRSYQDVELGEHLCSLHWWRSPATPTTRRRDSTGRCLRPKERDDGRFASVVERHDQRSISFFVTPARKTRFAQNGHCTLMKLTRQLSSMMSKRTRTIRSERPNQFKRAFLSATPKAKPKRRWTRFLSCQHP